MNYYLVIYPHVQRVVKAASVDDIDEKYPATTIAVIKLDPDVIASIKELE